MIDYKKLSKIISQALRHAPIKYSLILDNKGWVEIDDLLNSLSNKSSEWNNLNIKDLEWMIESSEKKRHEIIGSKIRAIYGHSTKGFFHKESSTPPNILYHGTSEVNLNSILKEGLKPMERQYVHLSSVIKEAFIVGKRKSKTPIILKIDAKLANDNGYKFYTGNDKIWLVKYVPPEYIIND
ncbi:RNA 2'-phosphotransferase [uncultured Algibacter sp.]|uniref:RNA 2'-phosphotransferase n=1 Tax=uncultured Algibacter sp. TaxID=298659 RepID=UPI0032176850